MFRSGRRFIGCLVTVGAGTIGVAVTAPVSPVSAAIPADTTVIINEVYGGGGNSGATLKQDFVELYNPTAAPVSLDGWSVQYRSAGATAPGSGGITALSGSIAANGYYLIGQAFGAGGTADLPTPDASGTSAMSGTGGQVLLAKTTTSLACTLGANGCAGLADAVDMVGWGASTQIYLGTGPGATTTNATSATRNAAHANTFNNATDFTTGTPSPTNSGVVVPPTPTPRTIEEIQGSGVASPIVGELVITRGVVTATYPTGGFNGFVIQTPGTGGLTTLDGHTGSNGLTVASPPPAGLAIGDYVEVVGSVQENFGLTRLASVTSVTELAETVAPVTAITAPWPATADGRESIESMLYRPQGTWTVTETYPTNQFGEVGLAAGDSPLMQPSDRFRPGTPEFDALAADNYARGVTLDDGASTNYLTSGSLTPPFITTDGTFRVGSTASIQTDVIVDYQFSAWRFQPLTAVTDANDSSFVTFAGSRPPAPGTGEPGSADLGTGEVKIATFNVLNYFTTGGAEYEAAHPGVDCRSYNDRTGTPITVRDCGTGGQTGNVNGPRGAWDDASLARQQAKTVAAINALDADVVGLMEVENSANLGEPTDEAIGTLVDALNAEAGAGTWAFVPSSADFPDQSLRDVITVAIIYRPAAVTPVGASKALGTLSDPGEAFENAREPLGQAFEPVGGGDPFFVAINHFKSKGCDDDLPPADPNSDQSDGQSCFNADRIEQAQALAAWVDAVLPTYSAPAVTDAYLLGDFNSYTFEDPMQVFYDAGYVDLNDHHGNPQQSYNFDAMNGSLDHILANASALRRVTGSTIWNINAPESLALEYSRFNYNATDFYVADPYRSSDHDPEIAAITAATPPVDITLVSVNDFHGRIDANTVKWAGTVEQIVAGSNGNVAITGAGDLVGASLFASAVADDQPTIDVMNAIGLDASAVGNHEFDKGWPDLRDRIIGAPDARNAEWDYLGANVYDSTTGETLLPEYSIMTFDGVRVGVIGAVTEETPALVSPAGMVGVTIGDPVEAVNRVAAELSDGDTTNGEADVLVATFHEGAPSGAATLEANIAAGPAFADIVNGVSAEVDVLFNGHTHQAYVYSAPVPGVAGATRPVLQTGSYGDFVGKVQLSVDPDTGDVTVVTAQNVPRTTVADADLIAQYPQLAEVNTIVQTALANAATVGNIPIGRVSNDITTAYTNGTFGPTGYQATRNNTNRDQRNLESTLGGLVAEALYETLDPLGVDLPTDVATIGVVNPGGLRAELFYPTTGAEGDGVVTYAEANGVLPFVNNLWTTHLTGAQVKTMLEQQWQRDAAGNIPTRAYLQLGLSDNVSYTFDPALPEGSRITSITVDGQPIDPAATYKIATFSFLAAGGDNFRVFNGATSTADSGLVDRDAWISYLQDRAAAPGVTPDYVRRSAAVSPLPTTVNQGGTLATTLSYLDLTSLGSPENTSVDIAIGGVSLGSVPVTFSAAASGNAAPVNGVSGTAAVSVAVPATVPAGNQVLTFTVQPSGKVISVPVVVVDAVAPPAPVISTPADGAILATLTPAIGGTAEPDATVTVYDGGTAIGTTSADTGGNWTFTPAAPLASGVHVFTATATDAAGNTGAASAAVTVTLNTPGPAAPVITSPAPGSATSDRTPTISGTADAGTTVQVVEGATVLGSALAAADGSWTLTSPKLTQGPHTITATATDAGGLTSAPSAPVTFTVDSVKPGRPTITSPAQLAVVRTAAVPVAGTAEPGATVTVDVDGSAAGSAPVNAGGSWSLATPPLHNGLHLVTARATDPAGNRSAVSNPVLILVCDSAAPGGRFSLGWLLFCRGR